MTHLAAKQYSRDHDAHGQAGLEESGRRGRWAGKAPVPKEQTRRGSRRLGVVAHVCVVEGGRHEVVTASRVEGCGGEGVQARNGGGGGGRSWR